MAALVCDLCGGKLIMGAGGIATCDSCGMEHSADRMKEKVQEVRGVVQTDSSHLVANYLEMATNAINASNNAEAESYCNKIIEVDPTNFRAWMIKGEAAAWQSTLANSRINEGVNAFAKGIKYAPEEEKENVVEKAGEQIKYLCVAMVKLQAERFSKWPDEEETTALISMLTAIVSTVVDFLSQTGEIISIGEIMKPVASLINQSVVQAYNNFYPDYKSDRYPYPDRDDWEKYIKRLDFCITLVEKAISISGGDGEDDIQRYENLIFLEKEAVESCAYDWEYMDYGKEYGSSHVRQVEAIIRQNGLIPDSANSRAYGVSFRLTEQSKRIRQGNISKYENKIKAIKAEKARKEAAERAEKERIAREAAQRRFNEYWAAHAEEKKNLETELDNLKSQINTLNADFNSQVSELNEEIAAIPGNAEITNINERIKKLVAEKESLGWFKGKEKKAIQEQIDQLSCEKSAIQNRMAAARNDLEAKIAAAQAEVQKKIAPMQSRVNAINNELTRERGQITEKKCHIKSISKEQVMAEISKGNEEVMDFLAVLSEEFMIKYLDGEDLSAAVVALMEDEICRHKIQNFFEENNIL